MRGLLIGAVLMTALPAVAAAQMYGATPYAPRSGSAFDPQSGSAYNYSRNSAGQTTVNGSNLNTGATWNTRIEPNGNESGLDSRGNTWSYDARTGNYMNSNGHGCSGQGNARFCW